MRDVNAGWLLRYAHMNGASFFFIVTYIHIFRGLLLRLVQGAARAGVDARPGHLLPDDGDGVHGLRPALGADELLGRAGHHRLLLGFPGHRRAAAGMAARRICARRGRADPLLLAPLSAAVRDRRGRDPAHLGAAHPGFGQSDRRRRQDRARYAAVPPVLHGQGRLVRGDGAAGLRDRHLFRAELSRPPRQLHPGQPAGDAGAYRARMVFLAVLRDPALVHGRLHPAGEAVGRAGDVRLDPAAVLPAVARQLAGPLGRLPPGVQALLLAAGRST